jgi:uncharacterized ion transporter superfamily protein YfcC
MSAETPYIYMYMYMYMYYIYYMYIILYVYIYIYRVRGSDPQTYYIFKKHESDMDQHVKYVSSPSEKGHRT